MLQIEHCNGYDWVKTMMMNKKDTARMISREECDGDHNDHMTLDEDGGPKAIGKIHPRRKPMVLHQHLRMTKKT
jgi:hypothetical protein